MRVSDGATWIPPGMLGFARGCTGRAVRWVRLNQDENAETQLPTPLRKVEMQGWQRRIEGVSTTPLLV